MTDQTPAPEAMSTKLNAKELAAKRYDEGYMHLDNKGRAFDITNRLRECAEATIREVAQPLADERDALREALEAVLPFAEVHALNKTEGTVCNDVTSNARAVLAKYKKP